MLRKLTKYSVISITLLTAYLISEIFVMYLNEWHNFRSYKAVALRMISILIIYFPVVTILDKLIHKFSKEYIRTSKSVVKSSTQGLFIGLFIAFLLLFGGFSYVWYDINILRDLQKFFSSLF